MTMENTKDLTIITADINRQLKDPKIAGALLETTFKGLSMENMQKAILEGVIRGFTFKDFLEKKVYAIKYGQGYSLVTSIDNNRVIGMRSGIVGTDAPIYTMTEEKTPAGIPKPESATITVHRKVGDHVGAFTATVYFDEYYKPGSEYNGQYKPSMWDQKPRTMIAKVAEMHALRKACPEELAQAYVEEEFTDRAIEVKPFDVEPHYLRLSEATSLSDLQTIWASMPIQAKQDPKCIALKDELKAKLAPASPSAPADSEPVIEA